MRLLIVVDMQKDFVDGTLGTAEAQAIVPAVCEKIQKFDGAIIVTQDTHQANYLDTQEGSILPVTHCVQNTPGWELDAKVYAAVKSRGDAAIRSVMKPTFGSVELVNIWSIRATMRISKRLFWSACVPTSASSPTPCSSRRFCRKSR